MKSAIQRVAAFCLMALIVFYTLPLPYADAPSQDVYAKIPVRVPLAHVSQLSGTTGAKDVELSVYQTAITTSSAVQLIEAINSSGKSYSDYWNDINAFLVDTNGAELPWSDYTTMTYAEGTFRGGLKSVDDTLNDLGSSYNGQPIVYLKLKAGYLYRFEPRYQDYPGYDYREPLSGYFLADYDGNLHRVKGVHVSEYGSYWNFKFTQRAVLRIVKRDQYERPLAGVKFKLIFHDFNYSNETHREIGEFETNQDGILINTNTTKLEVKGNYGVLAPVYHNNEYLPLYDYDVDNLKGTFLKSVPFEEFFTLLRKTSTSGKTYYTLEEVVDADYPYNKGANFSPTNIKISYVADNGYSINFEKMDSSDADFHVLSKAIYGDTGIRLPVHNIVTTNDIVTDPPNYRLGNYVWFDNNRNGVQDDSTTDSDAGVNGVTVTISGDNLPADYAATTQTATVTVDGEPRMGYYQFDGLPAGDYTIAFSNLPEDYQATTSNVTINGATSANDSNGLITTASLSYTVQEDLTLDLGLVKTVQPTTAEPTTAEPTTPQPSSSTTATTTTQTITTAESTTETETTTEASTSETETTTEASTTEAETTTEEPTTEEQTSSEATTAATTATDTTATTSTTIAELSTTPTTVQTTTEQTTDEDVVNVTPNSPSSGTIEIEAGEIPLSVSEPQNGSVSITEDGQWLYVPAKDFVGRDQFTITIQQTDGTLKDVTVELNIDPLDVPLGELTLPKTTEAFPKVWIVSACMLLVAGYLLFKTE